MSDIYYIEKSNGNWKTPENILTGSKNISSIKMFYDENMDKHIFWANDSTIKHENLNDNIMTVYPTLGGYSGKGSIRFSADLKDNAGVVAIKNGNKLNISSIYNVDSQSWSAVKTIDKNSYGDFIQDIQLNKSGELDIVVFNPDSMRSPNESDHSVRLVTEDLFPELNVENKTANKNITLSPNPAKAHLTVKTKNAYIIEKVKIFDIDGNKVYSNNNVGSVESELQLKGFRSGVYYVKIFMNSKSYTAKILINK